MSSGQPGASVSSRETAPDPFRPSEYTGLLVHTLRSHARDFGRGLGLDMGMGSGVLLATLGALGMQRLYGVDIDPAAIGASRRLIGELGLLDRTCLLQGSLWEPLDSLQFDVVVANLPNFAATEPSDPNHSRFWSMGGPNGRQLLDPFLAGLRAHLRDDGVAFMTQNAFAGFAETQAILAEQGLTARIIQETTSVLHPVKSVLLNREVRSRSYGTTLLSVGPYEFADVQVLEIRPGS